MKIWVKILSCIVVIETVFIVILSFKETKVSENSPDIIISTLGTLLTFVVAWQIWQVIDTKDTIKKFDEKFKEEKKERVQTYNDQMSKLSLFIFASSCIIDAILVMSDTHNTIYNKASSIRQNLGYNWAYKILLKSIEDLIASDSPEASRHIDLCLDNMESCLNNAERLKYNYEKYAIFDRCVSDLCDHYYENIINEKFKNKLSHDQHVKLENLRQRRAKLTIKN